MTEIGKNIVLGGQPDRFFMAEDSVKPFRFNQQVAEVFDDMAVRSIPLYRDTVDAVSRLAVEFYKEGTWIYDLGCSTGTLLFNICLHAKSFMKLCGIDSCESMITQAEKKRRHLSASPNSQLCFRCESVLDSDFEPASVIVLNYVLQFIPREQRQDLLAHLFAKLVPEGVLILSEKTCFSDNRTQLIAQDIYDDFKLAQKYSAEEIARKKIALENVLIPLSLEENINLLKNAGFNHVEVMLKWQHFTTLIAYKGGRGSFGN